jgi:hypothetical protein
VFGFSVCWTGVVSHFIDLKSRASQPAPRTPRPITVMDAKSWIAIVANFIVIAGLISYGFNLFAEYHATGRWAKNVTGLLAGIGMLALAASMLLTPRNALVILQVAQTGAARVFLIISSVLLMAAIAAFGIINYSRPLRLWHQRRIGRDLRRGLPRIP